MSLLIYRARSANTEKGIQFSVSVFSLFSRNQKGMNSEEQLVSTFQDDQNYISPPSPKPLKRRKKVAAGFYEWRKSKETGDGNEIQNPEEDIYNIPDYFSPSIRHCSPESQKRIVKNALMNNPKLAARFDKWMKKRNEKRAIEAAAQNALKHPQRTIEVDQKIIQYEQCLQNPEFKTNLQKAMQKIILLLHAENCFQHDRISHTHQYYYEVRMFIKA